MNDEQSEADGGDAQHPQRTHDHQSTYTQRDQTGVRDSRVQRAPVQFVERMRGNADGEEEREQRRNQPRAVGARREGGADDHVRQVPRGVRRMQEGPPVAPAARAASGIERGAGHDQRSGFVAHITSPPPRLIERTPTFTSPASCHARTVQSTGYRS